MKQVSVKVFNREGQLVGPLDLPRVEKTDDEWKKQLTPEQYADRTGAWHRAAVLRHAARQQANRRLFLHLLRAAALCIERQVRFGHRLAELLPADRRRERRDEARSQLRHGARRDPVRALRLPSRPRVHGRAAADAAAALREFGVARVHRRRGAFVARRPRRAVGFLRSVAALAKADGFLRLFGLDVRRDRVPRLVQHHVAAAGQVDHRRDAVAFVLRGGRRRPRLSRAARRSSC